MSPSKFIFAIKNFSAPSAASLSNVVSRYLLQISRRRVADRRACLSNGRIVIKKARARQKHRSIVSQARS